MKSKQREEQLTLELLLAVAQRSDVTQRHLARRMGVALGLANSYLKRCTRKGLIKIQQAPANRYLYYLTPQGFAEKSRLTAEYLTVSFGFYRTASKSCADAVARCRSRDMHALGLYGLSELAEIAAFKVIEQGLQLCCVVGRSQKRFLGYPVFRDIPDAPDVDGWLFTTTSEGFEEHYRQLVDRVGAQRVVAPSILGVQEDEGHDAVRLPGGSRTRR